MVKSIGISVEGIVILVHFLLDKHCQSIGEMLGNHWQSVGVYMLNGKALLYVFAWSHFVFDFRNHF